MQCASSRKPNLIVQASWTDLIASVYAQSAWNIHTFLSVLINGEFITNVMQSTFNHYINVLSLLWLWNIIVASCILSALLFYDLSRSLFFHLYSSAQIAFISKFWTFFFALLFVQNHSIQSFKDAQDIPTRNISSFAFSFAKQIILSIQIFEILLIVNVSHKSHSTIRNECIWMQLIYWYDISVPHDKHDL